MKFRIFKFESVTSTNDMAIDLIREEKKELGVTDPISQRGCMERTELIPLTQQVQQNMIMGQQSFVKLHNGYASKKDPRTQDYPQGLKEGILLKEPVNKEKAG